MNASRSLDVQADMPVSVGGVDIWLGRIPRRRQRPLTVVVTRVGKPRNVPMAMRVQTLMSFFDIGTLALMGISAGFEGKIALGDVVVADRVYDYEHVRSELPGQTVVERPRPLILEVPLRVTSDLDLFEVHSMKNKYRELTRRQDLQKSPGGKGWKTPRLDRGTIAAGERLLADGSLSLMRERMDNRILAGNQEDSGFAQVAELAKVPWCIFRGISDYGDPAKPVSNEWHFAASLAAAAAGVSFFQYAYRPQDDGPF